MLSTLICAKVGTERPSQIHGGVELFDFFEIFALLSQRWESLFWNLSLCFTIENFTLGITQRFRYFLIEVLHYEPFTINLLPFPTICALTAVSSPDHFFDLFLDQILIAHCSLGWWDPGEFLLQKIVNILLLIKIFSDSLSILSNNLISCELYRFRDAQICLLTEQISLLQPFSHSLILAINRVWVNIRLLNIAQKVSRTVWENFLREANPSPNSIVIINWWAVLEVEFLLWKL